MISKARQRPRVRSVNFRTFWWLVRMESLRMVAADGIPYTDDTGTRRLLYNRFRYHQAREFNRLLRYFPARRVL